MSKSRRSLVRSTLFNFRQLWQRREQGRREVRRILGTSFERLEDRLALNADPAYDPNTNFHIHAQLDILINGDQVVIPKGVGDNRGAESGKIHTHDFSNKIHIHPGPRSTFVTLDEVFQSWRTDTALGNPNATFSSTNILGNTANSTHTVRMYVNGQLSTDFGAHKIHDEDKIVISFEPVNATNRPSFDPIPDQTVLGGAPSWLGIDGFDPNGGTLTYTVQSSNPSLLSASITPATNKTLVLTVEGYGQMKFQLFNDLAPRTTQHIETLVANGEFATLAKFYRISRTDETQRITRNSDGATTFSFNGVNSSSINLSASTTAAQMQTTLRTIPALSGVVVTGNAGGPFTVTFSGSLAGTDVPLLAVNNNNAAVTALAGANDFVIQGGPADSSSSLGQFDDEYHVDLQFTTPGLLAMAKSSDDTNDSQVFITGGPARFLDMQHSIFGVLTDGEEVRRAIQHTGPSGDGAPPTDIVITSAQIITDTENAALKLKAAEGASGTATVTVTVSDGSQSFSQTFNVTVTPDTANSAPFLNPIAPVSGAQGQPITIQLTAQDVENNPMFFDATKGVSSDNNYTLNVNNTTGLVTITPIASFTGTFQINVGVRGTTQTTTQDQFDMQRVTVTVAAGAPTVDLVQTSDTGTSSTDNITNAASLEFLVTNVTPNATVQLLKGNTVLATGTVGASANSITLTVSNPGVNLGQGVSGITARQTVNSQQGPVSSVLNVTYDSTAPIFSSAAPTSAPIGFDLAYNAQTNEEGSGVVYTLTGAPAGATINSSTGLVTFTPTSSQSGTQSFGIIATDAAGNPATQAVTLAVSQPKIDMTVTLTTPTGTPLTSLTPNQDFVLHVFANDIRQSPKGVFSAYVDVIFDGTKATVTGPIVYGTNYQSGKSGTTTTAGLIDEAGAFAGTSELGGGPKEVFSVPMRATAAGTLTFKLDPRESDTLEMLVYGTTDEVPSTEIHFGSATVNVGATFNAVNDAFTVSEDTQNNTINPLANDASLGGAQNTLTISAVGTTSNGGTVTITQNSTRLSYTPAANFTGTETFTYTARNQNGETQVGTVTMTVTNVNDPPVAVNDTFSAGRNSSGNVLNVLANDTLGNDTGETLRVTAVGPGSKGGTITIGNNGANIVYTPAANATGAETFTYTISDQATGGLTATATVTVNISALTAAPDSTTVAEDSAATTIDVLANDALDPQVGGTLTISGVGTTSKGGTVAITQNSTRISYTPAANFQGTETFTYTISDGQGNNATNTVTVTVTNVNDPPVAANDTLTAFKNTTTTFDVLANDNSGPDPAENLLIDAVTQPATGGTVSIVENGKKISFVPASGFSGTTSFTYTIKDPSGATATATANVTVQDFSPSTLAGFVYFDVNNNGIKDAGEAPIVGVTITLTGTATAGSQTAVNQTVKTGDDGSYRFENLAPGTNYTIRQTQPLFTIDGRETVGSLGGTATNNQFVIATFAQGVNGTGYNFGELGRAASTISLRDFFSSTSRNYAHAAFDSNGVELWHTTNGSVWNGHTGTTFSLVNNKTVIRTQATNGNSQVVAKTQSASQLPVYKPGSSGTNSLYYIPGGPGNTPAANNATPVGVADSYSTPINTALTVNAANGVLKNDTDAENNSLSAFVVTQPANGTLSLNTNGSFTFTPTTGFTGSTSFTYRVSDGNSDSAPVTVTISVGGNGTPTAVADSFNATEDTPLTVTAANGLLKNDTDPENNALTAIINTQPSKGTISLAADGSFTYTPTANANGTDTFTYRASDGTNQSAVTTVTITIAPVNDAPTVVNDSFTTTRNTALNQAAPGVLVNDTDVDGQTLTVTVAPNGNPSNGTLSLNSNGSFVYTPNNNFTGTDTFTYRASDGTLTADGVVTITINPPTNQPPVANADTFSTNEDTVLTVTTNNGVLGNDTDPENDPRTAEVVTQPSHGSLTLNSDGTFTYTPTANFNGTDFFTYRAKDATGQSTPATVTITVNSVNDVPVAVNDTYEVDPGATLNVPIGTGVLANDTDADGTTGLTVEVVNQPANGTLSLNANGSFSYTPNTGFAGNDTFTYKTKDGTAESTPATVTIKVQAVPEAANDTYSVDEDTQLAISSTTAGLLGNDTDDNQDPLTAAVVQQPANGTVVLNTDGTFTYTPNANFSGVDTFLYKANDGNLDSNVATVTITVDAVNDQPARTSAAAAAIDVAEDSANTTAVSLGLSALTYGPGGGADESTQTLTYTVTAIPAFVTLFLADGTTAVEVNDTLNLAELNGLTYKTLANASGSGSITWSVQDSGGTANGGDDTLTDSLAITVDEINDAPERTAGTLTPIDVSEDSANTTAVSLGLSALLYGPGGGTAEATQTFTYKVTGIPAFMNLFRADGTTPVVVDDSLTLEQLQGLTYKTVANGTGAGSITFTVQDSGGTAGGGVDTITETLGVTVAGINDAPIRTAGAPAAISVAEDSANGTAASLGLSALAYAAGPGTSEDDQTLTITITEIPAFIEVFHADGTTPVNVNDELSLAELQGLTYKTVADGHGSATLTWTVRDDGGTANGGVDTLTETLGISVIEVNDAPSFTLTGDPPTIADDAGGQAITSFATNIDAGAANESGQTLTFTVTATGTTGSLTFAQAPAIDSAGNLTYTITPGTNGTATFSVVLTDDGSNAPPSSNASAAQSFSITVTPAGGGGEGEAADAALAALLAGGESGEGESTFGDEVPAGEWEAAVDAAMSQLG